MKKIALLGLLILVLISTPAQADDITFEGSAIGAGTSQRASGLHTVRFEIEPIGVTPVSAAKIMFQGSPNDVGADNGAITVASTDIGTPDTAKFGYGLFYYRVNAVNYSKGASAAGSTFTAAHAISASKYGAINIYINASGTLRTAVPLTPQAYTTALLAITATEALTPPRGFIKVGMIVIQNDGSTWTANTDDLIDASDVTLAAFYDITSSFTEIDEYELVAGDITAQKGTFYLSRDLPAAYIRIFLSAITGEGNFVITDVQNK